MPMYKHEVTKKLQLEKHWVESVTNFILHTHGATERGRLRVVVEPTIAANNCSPLPPAGTRHLQQPEGESPG